MNTIEICINCNFEILIPILDQKEEYLCPHCEIQIDVWKNQYLQIDFDLKQPKDIICIDFGTSSLRAAIHKKNEVTQAIEIGKQFQSQIDDLSIHSAIWMSEDGSLIEFGERAVQLGFNPTKYKSSLFEISPKKWITDGSQIFDIDTPILKSGISKAHLISGLISLAIYGVSKQLKMDLEEVRKCEIRISHPIWDKKIENKLQLVLEKLLSDAFLVWDKAVNGIKTKELGLLLSGRVSSIIFSKQVVTEPIAAALTLFENLDNSLAFVIVIDVGAGTTDMAAFYSTSFDPNTIGAMLGKFKRQLLPLGKPLSIFKAGDLIDFVLIEILSSKNKKLTPIETQDIINRRRNIKESVFKFNETREYGQVVTYDEITNHPTIQEFIKEIKERFDFLIESCKADISPRIKRNALHRIDSIKVVFAGGGGKIKFLQDAIGAEVNIDNISMQIEHIAITRSDIKSNISNFLIGRLAVCLGGTTHKNDWPKVAIPSITSYRGLPP